MMASAYRQRGAALFVGLVMLVMLTLMVLAAVKMSTGNLKVVGNIQHRDEAIAAANVAIEQLLSNDFTLAPVAAVVPVDIDRDGTVDFTVQVAQPHCLRARTIMTSELDLTLPADVACFTGSSGAAGGLGGGVGQSFCSDTLWEVRATATHAQTGANVAIRQGIARRMSVTAAGNTCN